MAAVPKRGRETSILQVMALPRVYYSLLLTFPLFPSPPPTIFLFPATKYKVPTHTRLTSLCPFLFRHSSTPNPTSACSLPLSQDYCSQLPLMLETSHLNLQIKQFFGL